MSVAVPGAFQEWLMELPTEIAWAEAHGQPIVVPDPGTDHGRRLLRTMGAWIAESQIDRISLRGNGAHGFGKWLEHWKELKADGWDVTVLVDRQAGSVVAMASRIVRP